MMIVSKKIQPTGNLLVIKIKIYEPKDKEKPMKFTLAALVAGLLATPGTSIFDTFKAQDVASCKKFDELLKKTTNNKCSYDLLGESKACENALFALPIETNLEIALQAKKCTNDVLQKFKQDLEDLVLESVLSSFENDDAKETTQPANNKKNASKTIKINITETKRSYQRRDM